VKGRFQDNLEFLQWFYQYFTSSYQDRDYDPVERRKKSKGINQIKSYSCSAKNVKERRHDDVCNSPGGGKIPKPKISRKILASGKGSGKLKQDIDVLLKDKAYLEKELGRISTTAKAIENERDFYFKTLLKVETMCRETTSPENPDIKKILNILYSSNEETPRNNTPDPSPKPVHEEALVDVDGIMIGE